MREKREQECVREAMKGSILLTPLLCHFSERKMRNSPNLWAKCVVRTLSQIPHLMEETDLPSAGFESKYLLKLKRNSKQGGMVAGGMRQKLELV